MEGQVSLLTVATTKSENPLIQLLFDNNADYLLGRCQQYINVWRLPDPSPIATRPNDREPCYWIIHPFSSVHFLSIGPTAIVSYLAVDLTPINRWHIDVSKVESARLDVAPALSRRPSGAYPMSPGEVETSVEKVFVAPNKSTLLVQTSRTSAQGRRDTQFMLLATHFLSSTPSSSTTTPSPNPDPSPSVITAQPLPKPIIEQIEIALGFVVEDAIRGSRSTAAAGVRTDQPCSLAFIDRDFWVRTWSLDDTEGLGSKRHFFLPRDWINMDCLGLAQVTADGRLLCPRNGEVAVVHNGLKVEWVD